MYKRFFKKPLDIFFAFMAMLILSPVFIILFFLLFVSNKGVPFFFQNRPGKDGKIFILIKFKTMNDKKDSYGNLLPDKYRLTAVGKFVRKTSLDEIPQLLNVLKGDMSLVGPRPLLVEYLPLYNEFQKRRHQIKPGITGWAQVNGRNAITWKEKFEYDVWYVKNQSFKTDVTIIFKTIKNIVIMQGINATNSVTVNKFNGAN